MKELKVGERVNVTLEVVEQGECTDCFSMIKKLSKAYETEIYSW